MSTPEKEGPCSRRVEGACMTRKIPKVATAIFPPPNRRAMNYFKRGLAMLNNNQYLKAADDFAHSYQYSQDPRIIRLSKFMRAKAEGGVLAKLF